MRSFEDAFDELYRLGYKVAYRLLGERAPAQDAAQEALARAFAAWRRVNGHAEAWVSRVVTNLALDTLRRRGRRAPFAPAQAVSVDTTAAERLDLRRALAELPRRQREVVVLRYLADLPEATVTELLGCSVGTVKQHAHRGLEHLRQALGVEAECV